ncbi:hypothetical protein BDV24DRAFT_165324 [Aspergillus arachidicola]|uniref:BZIP domain-containing protein n=1 Tax=Aspergillus arachidicola TaxID=656916 RepID=A0A5N6Y1N4_9EURO|nr:hypothetical protein BDV24DRAFT_165324 [Aspergillus arachidicola]
MDYARTQLTWPQAVHDYNAEAEDKANKHRRRVQNRKNQRAHRLRLKARGSGNSQESRPSRVRRWRLDELDHIPSQDISGASSERTTTTPGVSLRLPHKYTGISPSTDQHTVVLRGSPSTPNIQAPVNLELKPFTFPLSLDHLLHLVQYNVFRAFILNMRTLNTVPVDSTICTMASPCLDDTALYPLKRDIPPSLIPTALQQTRYHSAWINVIPFPRVRDNLIRHEGRFDPWELMQDLVGELLNSAPAPRQRDVPVSPDIPAPDVPETQYPWRLSSGSDPDEVTAARKGFIVWGEPHEMKSWEATPGFLAKWAWVAEGCDELVEISNHWRMKRGEEPIIMAHHHL